MTFRRLRSSDELVSGLLSPGEHWGPRAPFLVCIHGGGCNSGYFTIKGHSTVERAERLGLPVLLVDRPGHGASPPLASRTPIADSVPLIWRFLQEVRLGDANLEQRDLVMIGHSIGGAVVLSLAAQRGELPIRAIAVSGIGDEPSAAVRQWDGEPARGDFPATDLASSLLLGPEGSYGWQAPLALRRSSEPWQPAEVDEIIREWPRRWPGVAARIDVPVHLRLAEHERIWQTGPDAIKRMAARLPAAPQLDAALLPDGGHLYEIHKRGPELIEAQLAFLADPGVAA